VNGYITRDRWTELRTLAAMRAMRDDPLADVLRDAADALEQANSAQKRLHEFVAEIAEDDWYAHGADHTDVQTAARRLLGIEPDPYA
jgi:hypothetical protein